MIFLLLLSHMKLRNYHRINWVLTNAEFAQFQALRSLILKKYPNWTIQKWFTANFHELAKKKGVIYMEEHEEYFIHKKSSPYECTHCHRIFQHKLPGKDLDSDLYFLTCDECLRKILIESGLWTDKHEKKYQIIYKGTN